MPPETHEKRYYYPEVIIKSDNELCASNTDIFPPVLKMWVSLSPYKGKKENEKQVFDRVPPPPILQTPKHDQSLASFDFAPQPMLPSDSFCIRSKI